MKAQKTVLNVELVLRRMNSQQIEKWWLLTCNDATKFRFTLKNLTCHFTQNFTCELEVTYTECNRRNVRDFGRVFLRSNPKHLYPNLNGYGDNGHRNVWASGVSTYCTLSMMSYLSNAPDRQRDMVMRWPWRVRYSLRKVLGSLRTTMTWVRVFL